MKLSRVVAFLIAFVGVASAATLARTPDGATIVNSGSTNAVGWSIALRSNGHGWVAADRGAGEGTARDFSVPSAVTRAFFFDLHAARAASAAGRPCMKSVSFGTTLNVLWHRWISPDLSCPLDAQSLRSLASDVQQIVAIAQPPTGLRRIHLPMEPHRALPTPTPR